MKAPGGQACGVNPIPTAIPNASRKMNCNATDGMGKLTSKS